MTTIRLQTASHYPINRKAIIKAVTDVLHSRLKGDVEVSVLFCGDRKMRQLNKQYRNLDKTTDVLSFPQHDPSQEMKPFTAPPDNVLYLGDIVVSFPQCIKEAAEDNMMVDDKIIQLVLHGIDHLMGIHHE
jgi:probable rRNA maturation factor